MNELFLNVVNMSLSASFIVLVVVLVRKVLNKAPKWICVLLWAIVAIRLICPITIESVISLLPTAEVINPTILVETPTVANEITTFNTGIPTINDMINPMIHHAVLEISVRDNVNVLQVLITILSSIWIVGVIGFILYAIISCIRIDRRIQTAVLLLDNIYQSENVHSPFVFGVIKPRIYLPSKLSEQDKPYVIAHEQMHIQRKDYLWKPIGFILLSIYWFNPILWLAYILLCKDIELACDEKVIYAFNHEQRADYSQSLLSCSVKQHMITACPIAFGEVGVKERVKQIVKYKKPSFWLIVVAIIISVIMGISLLTSPINSTEKVLKRIEMMQYDSFTQRQTIYTLSIDTSKLTNEMYTKEGYTFNKNEIIVNSGTPTNVYLSKVKLLEADSNYVVMEFAFDYDLNLNKGSFLYPYVIKEDGLHPLDIAKYYVEENKQDVGYSIYFYVSKDLLQTKDTIHYDVFLNKIDYSEKEIKYLRNFFEWVTEKRRQYKIVEVNAGSYGSDKFVEKYDASNQFIDEILAMDYKSYTIVDKFAYAFVDQGLHQFLTLNGVDGEYKDSLNLTMVEGRDSFTNTYELIVPSSLLNDKDVPYKVGDTVYLSMINYPYDLTLESELEKLRNGTSDYLKMYDEFMIPFEVVGVYESDYSENVYTSLDTCKVMADNMRDDVTQVVLQFYRMTFTVDEKKVDDFKKEVNKLLAYSQFNYGQKIDYQIKERE